MNVDWYECDFKLCQLRLRPPYISVETSSDDARLFTCFANQLLLFTLHIEGC